MDGQEAKHLLVYSSPDSGFFCFLGDICVQLHRDTDIQMNWTDISQSEIVQQLSGSSLVQGNSL